MNEELIEEEATFYEQGAASACKAKGMVEAYYAAADVVKAYGPIEGWDSDYWDVLVWADEEDSFEDEHGLNAIARIRIPVVL